MRLEYKFWYCVGNVMLLRFAALRRKIRNKWAKAHKLDHHMLIRISQDETASARNSSGHSDSDLSTHKNNVDTKIEELSFLRLPFIYYGHVTCHVPLIQQNFDG